jgi:hypothetical protein
MEGYVSKSGDALATLGFMRSARAIASGHDLFDYGKMTERHFRRRRWGVGDERERASALPSMPLAEQGKSPRRRGRGRTRIMKARSPKLYLSKRERLRSRCRRTRSPRRIGRWRCAARLRLSIRRSALSFDEERFMSGDVRRARLVRGRPREISAS